MALKIEKAAAETPGDVLIQERLYLNADKTRVVAQGDPDAAFLFATPGDHISRETAQKYGLIEETGPAEMEEAKSDKDMGAGKPKKKESRPGETKEVKPQETK